MHAAGRLPSVGVDLLVHRQIHTQSRTLHRECLTFLLPISRLERRKRQHPTFDFQLFRSGLEPKEAGVSLDVLWQLERGFGESSVFDFVSVA